MSLERIVEDWNQHKGEFVITDSNTIHRLMAIVEDDYDYYYLTYNGRKFYLWTCVGKFIVLKNKIDDEDYNEFIRLAKLNHYDQVDNSGAHKAEIVAELLKEDNDPDDEKNPQFGTNKLVTEICWDLN